MVDMFRQQPAQPYGLQGPSAIKTLQLPEAPPAVTPESVATQPASNQPLGKTGFWDAVGSAIFGAPEANLSPEEQKAKRAKRQSASADASQMANDVEGASESYMRAPVAGGGSMSDILSFVTRTLSL